MKYLLCTVCALCFSLFSHGCRNQHQHEIVPQITVTDLHSGSSFKLSFASDQITVVNLWATWCTPCKAEIKHLIELYNAFSHNQCRIIGIALDSIQPAALLSSVQQLGIPYPVYAGNVDEILRATGVSAIPATIFIDRNGIIIERLVGYYSAGELSLVLERIIGEEAQKKKPSQSQKQRNPSLARSRILHKTLLCGLVKREDIRRTAQVGERITLNVLRTP